MKKKIAIIIIIVIALITALILKTYIVKYNKYKNYIDSAINTSVYGTYDSLIEMDALIEKTINKGYISETELAYLKSQYGVLNRNFYDYDNLSRYLRGFTFFEVDNRHEFNYEYFNFYNRIDDLFDNRNYNFSFEKYFLDNEQLDIFKKSYQYTSSVVSIIRKYIDYYNTFYIEIAEEETQQGIMVNSIKHYNEEYLKSWPDNKTGSGSSVSSDGHTEPIEVPRYDYPQKPHMNEPDDVWYHILQEIKLLNLEDKY